MKGILMLIIAAALAAGGCSASAPDDGLEVIFFDVGKADAFLFTCGGERMIIDAGTGRDGEYIAGQLRQMEVEDISAMVITHFDKDHVGGAARIIEEFGVKTVFQPAYMKLSQETEAYRRAAEEFGAEVVKLEADYDFSLGSAEVHIECPRKEYEKDASNNSSLITTVVHGRNSMLFTGDIEKERIRDWLDEKADLELKYDFLKVPHHGRYEKILPEFFERVGAEYGVITSSDKHPEDTATLEAMKKAGTVCYLTKNGTIRLNSDGRRIDINQ